MSSTTTNTPIKFGPFEVTEQVFYKTAHSYGLVNIKPLLPGHVMVVPLRPVARLTDLTIAETTDLFTTVQKVQRMLARVYFPTSCLTPQFKAKPEDGAFNIAIQDGAMAGQSVPHLHCHVIPRMPAPGDGKGDGIYEELAGEEGNVGGGLWDKAVRECVREMGERFEVEGAVFPKIEDADRKARTREEMVEEARMFEREMRELELDC